MADEGTAEGTTQDPAEDPTEETDVVLSDAPAIRVLAHPARLLAVERLYAAHGSTFTATELADEVGLTPSAMSYHLRALEKHGVVARAAGDGDERRRPWRAAGTRLVVKRAPGQNPAGRAAIELLAGEMLERLRTSLQAMSDRVDDDVERWRVGGLSPATLRLDPEQAGALTKELEDVLERYRAQENSSVEDVRVVEVLVAVVPGPPRS